MRHTNKNKKKCLVQEHEFDFAFYLTLQTPTSFRRHNWKISLVYTYYHKKAYVFVHNLILTVRLWWYEARIGDRARLALVGGPVAVCAGLGGQREVAQEVHERARRPPRHAQRIQVRRRDGVRQLGHTRDVHMHPVAAHEVLGHKHFLYSVKYSLISMTGQQNLDDVNIAASYVLCIF